MSEKKYFDVLQRITDLRLARGLSVYRLAKLSGIPQSTIATWYQKKLSPPIDKIERVCDAIVAHGEILSSAIVTGMFEDGVPHLSLNYMRTVPDAAGRILDWQETERLVKQDFAGLEAGVHVAQGFISRDKQSGDVTNLGRGGSDYTAAILATLLDAEALEIWTDVDGFMTADPRTHPDATVIPQMTYAQAQEMCDAGAKVIYPPTIAPVAMKHIPVWVKNTFNPAATGTVIVDD